MSLIEQALRRLQEPLFPTPPTTPGTSRPAPQEANQVHPWPTTGPTTAAASTSAPAKKLTTVPVVAAFVILALTAGLLGGGVFWMSRTVGRNPVIAVHPTDQGVAQSRSLRSSSPLPPLGHDASTPAASQEPFVLSGIVEGSGAPYAVINGAIVAVGEQLGGATLLDISGKSVTLRLLNGKVVELHLPN